MDESFCLCKPSVDGCENLYSTYMKRVPNNDCSATYVAKDYYDKVNRIVGISKEAPKVSKKPSSVN